MSLHQLLSLSPPDDATIPSLLGNVFLDPSPESTEGLPENFGHSRVDLLSKVTANKVPRTDFSKCWWLCITP